MDCIRVWKTIDGTTKYVTIDTTRAVLNVTKLVSNITIPVSSDNGDSTSKPTKIIDFNRIEKRLTVDGHISNGAYSYSPTDSSTTAVARKNDFLAMIMSKGVVNFRFEGADDEGIIDKADITSVFTIDDKTNGAYTTDGEVGYDVKFTIVYGENLIN